MLLMSQQPFEHQLPPVHSLMASSLLNPLQSLSTSLPSSLLSLSPLTSTFFPSEPSSVAIASSPPSFDILLNQIGLLPVSLPSVVVSECAAPPLSSFSSACSSRDSLEVPTTSRRLSAPETLSVAAQQRQLEASSARRRFSDFSIESLLSGRRRDQSSLSLIGPVPPGEEPRTSTGRKQRTIYGLKQTEVLEQAFTSQQYMVGAERELLAARLGLSEAQVRVWFQNRRSKQRKQNRSVAEAAAAQQAQATQQQSAVVHPCANPPPPPLSNINSSE